MKLSIKNTVNNQKEILLFLENLKNTNVILDYNINNLTGILSIQVPTINKLCLNINFFDVVYSFDFKLFAGFILTEIIYKDGNFLIFKSKFHEFYLTSNLKPELILNSGMFLNKPELDLDFIYNLTDSLLTKNTVKLLNRLEYYYAYIEEFYSELYFRLENEGYDTLKYNDIEFKVNVAQYLNLDWHPKEFIELLLKHANEYILLEDTLNDTLASEFLNKPQLKQDLSNVKQYITI